MTATISSTTAPTVKNSKKGYYAIRAKGNLEAAIYTSWNDCEKVTKGNSRYHRRFSTLTEAQEFIECKSHIEALNYSKGHPPVQDHGQTRKKKNRGTPIHSDDYRFRTKRKSSNY